MAGEMSMTDDVDAVEAVDDGEAVEGTEKGDAVDEAESLEDAEDFDPVGTAVLIAIYMAIVAGMWVFTYFVEFLGRGVSIVG
jgi:hypothetical protein